MSDEPIFPRLMALIRPGLVIGVVALIASGAWQAASLKKDVEQNTEFRKSHSELPLHDGANLRLAVIEDRQKQMHGTLLDIMKELRGKK